MRDLKSAIVGSYLLIYFKIGSSNEQSVKMKKRGFRNAWMRDRFST